MRTITATILRDLVDTAIAERGADWTYPEEWRDALGSCQYAQEDAAGNLAPACIVGHVLWQIDPAVLKWVHANGEGRVAEAVLYDLKESGVVGFTEDALEAALRLQMTQDDGSTWGFSHHWTFGPAGVPYWSVTKADSLV